MERIVYTIRFYDKIRKSTGNTRWKMTVEEAQVYFAETKWEILEYTKEVRKTGLPIMATSMAHFQGKGSKG